MIVQAAVGQSAKVILACQFLSDTGTPATPTGVEVKVLGGSPVVVKATLVPVETAGLTGFMVAELDVSNVAAWPSGQYAIRWTGTTSGSPTSVVDSLQLVPSSAFAAIGALGNSYTTEARIRQVSKLLDDTVTLPAPAVALEAERGAAYIDGKLAARYTVPFPAPYPPAIVLLNDWKSAALCLDRFYGENGNRGVFSQDLHEWVDKYLEAILEGGASLGPTVPVDVAGGAAASSPNSKHSSVRMPSPFRDLRPGNRT